MYVLDSVSTSPWVGSLDDVYPVKIENITPVTVEPNTTFSINYTLRNTHSASSWSVWGKLYQGTGPTGTLLSQFDSGVVTIAPNGTYSAPATVINGGIGVSTSYYIEAGHVTLDEETGACCIGGNCSLTTQANCAGVWQGAGTSCITNPCAGPGDCINPSGANGTNRCINGYVYNCSNGSWEPAFPITECEIECVGTDTSCIDGYINDCNYGTWEPSGDRCFVEPAQSKMLIVAAAVLGGLTIIALLSRSRK